MRIITVTGSRSDRNAITVLTNSLRGAGHDVDLVSVHPESETPVRRVPEAMTDMTIAIGHSYPDVLFLHGDRHEILGAAVAANILGVPIAHIGGGDVTEGSQDDSFRHAITKLSHLHFPSHEAAARRIIQMGEERSRVIVTGCPGIDALKAMPVLDRDTTFLTVGLEGFHPFHKSILVLFHPNTMGDTASELKALSDALMSRKEALVLVGPNADSESGVIRDRWRGMARERRDTVYHDEVSPQLFYSLLRHCDVLVGNSSAGYYEAPCFGIPVVDLGDRQKGRPQASNVRNYMFDADRIGCGIVNAFGSWAPAAARTYPPRYCNNPYGDGHACERIVEVVNALPVPTSSLLVKKFQDYKLLAGDR